jgi:hypothetical protein
LKFFKSIRSVGYRITPHWKDEKDTKITKQTFTSSLINKPNSLKSEKTPSHVPLRSGKIFRHDLHEVEDEFIVTCT